eukprot:symbB.v1.2.008236.t1/scaffold513.1/size194650/7
MNFGRIGDRPTGDVPLQAPDLGGLDGVFKYLGKIGVLLLGGTFVVRDAEVVYAWADRAAGRPFGVVKAPVTAEDPDVATGDFPAVWVPA